MVKHRNIRVTGMVQGVFFRASAKEAAASFNLKGFVRNERDQSVYIEAEGNDRDLDRFVDWCRKGPPLATVSNVEVADGAVVGFSAFEIRRS